MAQTRSVGTMTSPPALPPPVPGTQAPYLPGAAPGRRPPPARTLRRPSTWTTPARLWLGLFCSALAILLVTAASALAVQNQRTAASQTSGVVEQRAINIQTLYYSLADADAAAATGILDSPAPPLRFTQRYQDDLTAADAALAEGSVDVAGDPAAFAQLELIDEQLSVYTGLIGTAQADNRIGYPVGGAYLREASNLLEHTMLPEVSQVQQAEISARSASASASGGVPLWALLAGLVAAFGCVWTWRLLDRSTRRRINAGLAAGMLISVVLLGWTAVASARASSDTTTATADFQQVSLAQEARSDLAQMSAEEALSVVSRGEDISSDEDLGTAAIAAQASLTDLEHDPAAAGSAAVTSLGGALTTIQKDEKAGDYIDATSTMVGTGTTVGGSQVQATALAATLATSVQQDQAKYQSDSRKAVGAYLGGPWPVLVLGLLAAAAAVSGINRRIAEYR
jgi:hypothetical protein